MPGLTFRWRMRLYAERAGTALRRAAESMAKKRKTNAPKAKSPETVDRGSHVTLYEAAVLTRMSPKLLQWLTRFAPKTGQKRKLNIASKVNDVVLFNRAELLAFNAWLKQPWPSPNEGRPLIPAGIRREVKEEASGACAMCNKHGETCEAAHLDAVAKTRNNHPDNLLWLCANHHTAYDKGLCYPREEIREFVSAYKLTLQHARRDAWLLQGAAVDHAFNALETCARLDQQAASATTEEQRGAIKHLATKMLGKLQTFSTGLEKLSDTPAQRAVAKKFKALGVSKRSVPERLREARTLREDFAASYGYTVCPLCSGKGIFDGEECPVCQGNRELRESDARRIELKEFDLVPCPLCEGTGRRDGDECPACGGEKRMQRRFADRVELSDYDTVLCPLCEGSGRFENENCPECDGDRRMERRHAERIDIRQYQRVPCPVCGGEGNADCPGCDGELHMQRRQAEALDVRDYQRVSCPLCKGSGIHRHNDCPVCDGEKTVERRLIEDLDVSEYKIIKCVACKGHGHVDDVDCHKCGGEGELERRFARDE